jgi:hypothetical protein
MNTNFLTRLPCTFSFWMLLVDTKYVYITSYTYYSNVTLNILHNSIQCRSRRTPTTNYLFVNSETSCSEKVTEANCNPIHYFVLLILILSPNCFKIYFECLLLSVLIHLFIKSDFWECSTVSNRGHWRCFLTRHVLTTHPWWWRQYAPLKRRSTIILHGSISQKTTLNI